MRTYASWTASSADPAGGINVALRTASYKRVAITRRVPRTPTRVKPRAWIAASTTGSKLITGNGETAANSAMQKWPAIDVTTTHAAPAAASRLVRRI